MTDTTVAHVAEEWRDVAGMEGYFQASSEGRIRSVDRIHMQIAKGGDLRPFRYAGKLRSVHVCASNGYPMVNISIPGTKARNHTVHSLVCSAFHGPRPDGAYVAHGDGNRQNPVAANLRWATPSENMEDARLHGTAAIGERHGLCRLTAENVIEIKSLRASGMRFKEIAARFGVSWETCRKINSGTKRKSIDWELANV